MQHFENLKDQVDKLIKSLPSPYQIFAQNKNCDCCNNDSRSEWRRESFCEKCQFAYDLLTNPFESGFLFLKEYFLTVQFIIKGQKSFDSQLLKNYSDSLHVDSVFKKITLGYSSHAQDIIELLQQFLATRKDSVSSTTKKYNSLEVELERILSKSVYAEYEIVRKAFISLRNKYDGEKFRQQRVELIEALDIRICPYCNRQYIDAFKRKHDSKTAIAQLDHFYPKADFPLYALSLYNFVPSCAKCNSLKSNNLTSYLYPYCNDADSENQQKHFYIQYKSVDGMRAKTTDFDIRLHHQLSDEKRINAEALHHEGLYENHKKDVQLLLKQQRLDNDNYRRGINNLFRDHKLSEQSLKEMLYGFTGDLEELKQKPLSKLAHDILDLNKK